MRKKKQYKLLKAVLERESTVELQNRYRKHIDESSTINWGIQNYKFDGKRIEKLSHEEILQAVLYIYTGILK
jgi:hypothetical protein